MKTYILRAAPLDPVARVSPSDPAYSSGATYSPSVPLTDLAFCDWIGAAAPGDCIEYHTGNLGVDLAPSTARLEADGRRHLKAVAKRAQIAHEAGLIHLFSIPIADTRYQYLAMRAASLPSRFRLDRLDPARLPPAANHDTFKEKH